MVKMHKIYDYLFGMKTFRGDVIILRLCNIFSVAPQFHEHGVQFTIEVKPEFVDALNDAGWHVV